MRKKSVLLALVILALGLVGTGLSALYIQNEYILGNPQVTIKVSYGFPLGWYGYSEVTGGWWAPIHLIPVYWFSLESLLLDAAFWVAISFFVCIAVMKALNMLHKRRASKNLSIINIQS